MNVKSPHGPAASVSAKTGRIGIVTGERETTLLSLDCANTVFDVLSAEANGVTAAKSGVEQHIQPDAFTRSDGPTFLIGSNVFLSPGREAVSLFLRWIFDPDCWIGLDQLGAGRPSEQSTHGVKEVSGLDRCRGASVAPSCNRSSCDAG